MNSPQIPLAHNKHVGYCTNVHPGPDLTTLRKNLTEYCIPIREIVAPQAKLGVGLWFSESSATEALQGFNLALLKEQLEEGGLVPFTLNGFPQGDFHSQVVKHRVYRPTWWQPERKDYTLDLIRVLDALLPAGMVGSISTLPIAWNEPAPTAEQLSQAAKNLLHVAKSLHQLQQTTGREIVIAIEPEPGCYLTDSHTFREFYENYLSTPFLSSSESEMAHRYLTLCHDVCHAAVMFEDQPSELRKLASDGIRIGKVQVSSAIEVDWSKMNDSTKKLAIDQLACFAEDRYLHQTTKQDSPADPVRMVQDLGEALVGIPALGPLGRWRVHFHVPIFLKSFGLLQSTQDEIATLLRILDNSNSSLPDFTVTDFTVTDFTVPDFTGHYEIETYAWGVLPKEMRDAGLVAGISQELQWFRKMLNA
ncbi:MAG: metabolite traffic protein EboE [Pirellula sp.]